MENKTRSSMRILAWAFCIFLLLSLRLSFAQESVVQGIVTDEQGKAVKNARLTLLDPTPGSGWPGCLAIGKRPSDLFVGGSLKSWPQ